MSERVNIAAYLPMQAARQPYTPALYFPAGRSPQGQVLYSHYTYRQLDRRSDAIARGLVDVGIGRGTRAVLMVKPSLELFALVFAMFKVGAVLVMVDPGLGLKNLKACLARTEPEAFIGIPAAHAARVAFGWGRATLKTLVTVGPRLLWGGHRLDAIAREDEAPFEMADTRADEIAAILYTSGSTGPPKGAVYTHGNFAAQVEALREMFQIQPGDIDLPTFPLFALFDPALGMTTVIPDMDATRPAQVDPRKIIEAIEDFGVTTMFGSPALLNTVGRYGAAHKIKLPTLKRVISAGAPLAAPVMERFAAMLPEGALIFPPYGATESLPVAVIDSATILGETWEKTRAGAGVCVGKPAAGIEVAVIPISDGPIEAWDESLRVAPFEIGEFAVKGPQVTRAYYNDPVNTALAKIPEGKEIWHRMGDLGYLDDEGRLWMCGRKSQRVITPDKVWFTVPCEAIFNEHPDVFRTALVGAKVGGQERAVICVEVEAESRGKDREEIKRGLLELGARFERTRGIDHVLFYPKGFPVDIRHNAKIRHEELTVWARKEIS